MLIFGEDVTQSDEMAHETSTQQEIWLFSQFYTYTECSEFMENLKISTIAVFGQYPNCVGGGVRCYRVGMVVRILPRFHLP